MKVIQLKKYLTLIITILSGVTIYNIYTPTTYAESGEFSVLADKSLTVSVPSSTTLNLKPTATGTFGTADINVAVSTNNRYGYTLNMTTTTTVLTGNAPLSSGTYPTIPTISSSGLSCTVETSATCDFTANSWGYKKGTDSTYSQILANTSMPIATTSSGPNSDTNTVTFGARLTNSTPSGTYGTTLNFIATINTPSGVSFEEAFDFADATKHNGYYKMQDMTSTICGYVATPSSKSAANTETAQLIDVRDNKVYWVAKLLDGKCWMTQNLDLDLSTAVTLTNDTTDLNTVANWTPERNTINSTNYESIATCSSLEDDNTGCWSQTNRDFAPGWANDGDRPYSDDPGYRYMAPTIVNSTNENWWDNGDKFYNSLEECQAKYAECSEHNMIGNYYNFAAATATNSVAETIGHEITDNDTDASMPNSICPKGWSLPHLTSETNTFADFMDAYGLRKNWNYAGLNTARLAPLHLVRPGQIDDKIITNAGVYGTLRSSDISSATGGYVLGMDGANNFVARDEQRYYGFLVRCVAK